MMENLSILLVEDHRQLAQTVLEFLEQQGASVDYAGDTRLARELVQQHHYDLMLLDVMLPGESGFQFCEALRKELSQDLPVIFMTARDQLDDKLEGFNKGGDDYIVKPFALPELAARVSAQIRRQRREVTAHTLQVEDLELDPGRQEARRAGQLLKLSPTAFRILRILMRESLAVSREQLERELWGDLRQTPMPCSHLYNLRKAMDKPFAQPLLNTMPGVGFSIHGASGNHH